MRTGQTFRPCGSSPICSRGSPTCRSAWWWGCGRRIGNRRRC
jgi:hypothetical protein